MHINSYFPEMAVVAREKLTGIGEHWGVLLPDGSVAHNTEERGEHFVSLSEFAKGKKIKRVRVVPLDQQQSTLWRIHQEVSNPKGYHPLNNNCEIFANRVTGHPAESPQVKAWFVFALAGFFCWAAAVR